MIYLDYNASNPLRPEISKKIRSDLGEYFGNPSSLHTQGRYVRASLERVRKRLLKGLGNPSGELLFTSGGTEADNMALKGVLRSRREKGNHLIISSVEHHAVLHSAEALEKEGFDVTRVPVDEAGRVDPGALKSAITSKTTLISVMQANSEVGTLQPIEEIGRMAKERGILFHTDAVQAFGKCPLDLSELPIDLLSLSCHKLGGFKGVGALYLRQGIKIEPLLHGGPHEHNLRAGTENLLGILGFGIAVEQTLDEQENGMLQRVAQLRDRLEQGLKERLSGVVVNGHLEKRLPGTSNISFSSCDGESLLMALDLAGICVSTGSACSSGSTAPSHVLVAMGLAPQRIKGAVRFSLGWGTSEEEIESCLKKIPAVVAQVRGGA